LWAQGFHLEIFKEVNISPAQLKVLQVIKMDVEYKDYGLLFLLLLSLILPVSAMLSAFIYLIT